MLSRDFCWGRNFLSFQRGVSGFKRKPRRLLAQKAAISKPIGKQGRLRSLYRFSLGFEKPEVEAREPKAKKTKFAITPLKNATVGGKPGETEKLAGSVPEKEIEKTVEKIAGADPEKAKGLEVVRITGLDQPLNKHKGLEVRTETPVTQHDAPIHTENVRTAIGGRDWPEGWYGRKPRPQSPIVMENTLGDIYYKTYTEDRANDAHVLVWSWKQKDTFDDFGACRDWLLWTFPPGEINRQRARGHESLYRAYVMGEANSSAAGYQILHEWQTMYQERASWEKYQWGLQGLRNKLQASEELLAKERKEWRVACENENKKMFAARAKITNLEADVGSLKTSEVALKEKYEEANSQRECVEKRCGDRRAQVQEKNESLEIDLVTEKLKADTVEEARKAVAEARQISTYALNIAQTNYAEAQSIVDSLLSDSEWMQNHGAAYVANSILNATELDQAVTGLTDAARAVGHRAGYIECAQHVETALKQHFGTRHCYVNDKAEEMLIKAEEVYDNLSLPIMDLWHG
ncbi:hypothetical protein Hanom_Chr13g01183071 [Helianthus anomalus]